MRVFWNAHIRQWRENDSEATGRPPVSIGNKDDPSSVSDMYKVGTSKRGRTLVPPAGWAFAIWAAIFLASSSWYLTKHNFPKHHPWYPLFDKSLVLIFWHKPFSRFGRHPFVPNTIKDGTNTFRPSILPALPCPCPFVTLPTRTTPKMSPPMIIC